MKNNGTEPAGTDLSPLLAGATTQAARDNATVAFHHFAQTHPDSFSAELAHLLLAHAAAVNAATERMETTSRQAHPEAVAKALNQVTQASRDQAAAVKRHPKWSYAFNVSIPVLTAALGMGIGVIWMMWHESDQLAALKKEHAQTIEAQLRQNLSNVGATLAYEVTNVNPATNAGHQMTVKISEGKRPGAWKLQGVDRDASDTTALVTLTDPSETPSPTPSPTPTPQARRRASSN